MGRIRDKMEQDLMLCGRSALTCESYLRHARAFVVFLGRSPSTATTRDVRAFLLHLLQEKKRNPNTVNVAIGALRFLFNVTLNRPKVMDGIRALRVDHPQPDVLSGSEVQRMIEHAPSLKYKALIMLMYGAGLRVAEARHLRVGDIDSKRMLLHVRRTKNRYDRVLPLADKPYKRLPPSPFPPAGPSPPRSRRNRRFCASCTASIPCGGKTYRRVHRTER